MSSRRDTDTRIASYFVSRVLELIDQARDEPNKERRLELELHALKFWEIARGYR